jgi:hypothetical protein
MFLLQWVTPSLRRWVGTFPVLKKHVVTDYNMSLAVTLTHPDKWNGQFESK